MSEDIKKNQKFNNLWEVARVNLFGPTVDIYCGDNLILENVKPELAHFLVDEHNKQVMKLSIKKLERESFEDFCKKHDLEIFIEEGISDGKICFFVVVRGICGNAHINSKGKTPYEAMINLVTGLNLGAGSHVSIKNKTVVLPYFIKVGENLTEKLRPDLVIDKAVTYAIM